MKKLLVLMMVLGIASAANVSLLISVDGVVDPPDTEINLLPSEDAIISIWNEGPTYSDIPVWLKIDCPATFGMSQATIYGDPALTIENLVQIDWNLWYVDFETGIPEAPPMTVALLGLGGLFLRRRK